MTWRERTRKRKKREPAQGTGRGAYIGNRVSLLVQKSQKGEFCEENRVKKVVQFQNGILEKKTSLPPGSIPEWNLGSCYFKVNHPNTLPVRKKT